jgi:hypothetical protein
MQSCAVCVPVEFRTHLPTEESQLYVGALQLVVHSCEVIVPWVSSVHFPVVGLQLYVGALQVSAQSLASIVLLESISHWPVIALQLKPPQSASVMGTWVEPVHFVHLTFAPAGHGQANTWLPPWG